MAEIAAGSSCGCHGLWYWIIVGAIITFILYIIHCCGFCNPCC